MRIHPPCKTGNSRPGLNAQKILPIPLWKDNWDAEWEPVNMGYICPLFKGINMLRALSVVGTKKALNSLVADTDGQFCCFQSQGACVEDLEINSIILQRIFTSEAHFPSLDSTPCSFFYVFIPFTLSVWPLRAGISLGLGLIWARKWISSASCSQCFCYLMSSPRKSGACKFRVVTNLH